MVFAGFLATASAGQGAADADRPAGPLTEDGAIRYRVGFLGADCASKELPGTWTVENIGRLKSLGFNTIQLNVAWGYRPADEPLNIEDVVELSPEVQAEYPQPVPLRCNPAPERRAQRRADLRHRIGLCRQAGLRTVFHFGAPYNAHSRYGDAPPNCISDPKVARRYELLLEQFAREFPGVDDILVYTYDQDAWLCSEFGPCPRCLGVPLHKRVVPFVQSLAKTWRKLSPKGLLWWEPWELSAGQVLKCVEEIETEGLGLALHCTITECFATLPVDRWLKNTSALAGQRNIPVIVEYFLGGASEEVDPLMNLSHPLVVLRGLKAIAAVPGVQGIKEYYGLMPHREDPNLRITGLFFHNPRIVEEEALSELARPYGKAAEDVIRFWRLTSEAMELFPWETSWFIRQLGKSSPAHSLSAAMLRGAQAHTPAWCSTRRAAFMKTDDNPCDPWMFEDVQLRCQMAGDRMGQALERGRKVQGTVPAELSSHFDANLEDLARFRRRALAYAYHLRETNLVTIMRKLQQDNKPVPPAITQELLTVLKEDQANQDAEARADSAAGKSPAKNRKEDLTIDKAIAALQKDPEQFLEMYFLETPNKCSKGPFSVTSR
jgi:hypothetical protein